MYLTKLTLENWGPYYGRQEIALTDTVYAVKAAMDDDPERSNWIGKSWFLGAIKFLLTGVKPETCPNEDGWISWGQDVGMVAGEFDDGTTISRTRKRGKSTQLKVKATEGEAKQDQAQALLYRLIGMNVDDLVATSFIEQKQIARLVLADPADRTEIVNSWLELGPLERAEDWLSARLSALVAEERALPTGDPDAIGELDDALEEVERTLALGRATRARLQEAAQNVATYRHHAAQVVKLGIVRADGKRIRAELDKLPELPTANLERRLETLMLQRGTAGDRKAQLAELVNDDWDGGCPLTGEKCPVPKDVRACGASMSVELAESEAALDQIVSDQEDARAQLALAKDRKAERDYREHRLQSLREQGADLLASEDWMEANGVPSTEQDWTTRLAECDAQIAQMESALAEGKAGKARAEAQRQALQQAGKRRKELEAAIRTHREALAVVGRQGAQRQVAESALDDIGRGANALLSAAGIDLAVEVTWTREGKGHATHCDQCGATYPKAAGVKQCPVCDAPRGPKLVEKLVIAPNDRSGAADDIAGLSFQLSASNWLRAKREAAWSVACIDEPFGALDRTNSKNLAAHLHAMIRGSYAFQQGFLVAHDASVMEALPARIQITGDASGSKLQVVI